MADEDLLLSLVIERRKMQIRARNDLDNRAVHIPEVSTWQHLYKNGNDKALMNVIGLNRRGFERLLVKEHLGRGGRPTRVPKSQALEMLQSALSISDNRPNFSYR